MTGQLSRQHAFLEMLKNKGWKEYITKKLWKVLGFETENQNGGQRGRKAQKNKYQAILPSLNTYLLLELKTCQIPEKKKKRNSKPGENV